MKIQMWREILDPYSLAVDELVVKFNHIIDFYRNKGEYSPIEQVTGRVKTISSIIEKANKKQIRLESFEEQIDDIAGVRIICQFVKDIYKVVEIIRARSDMKIKDEKDYIDNIKKSGYRSYHLIVCYNVETLQGTKELQVEIQIRTLAMNFWSTIEHSLQYKYKQNIPVEIRNRLTSAAKAVLNLDEEMSEVRDDIMEAQNSFRKKANMVSDILINIQNLYKVADKADVISIQDEFLDIYQNGEEEKLVEFSIKLDKISAAYNAQSLN
ncbi:MAG TPA: GTP pyrophosphokinase family protein [Clostridiales bacterium]|nr:GTP pyrophosphokinase family protein [Clostridiales bacterium]